MIATRSINAWRSYSDATKDSGFFKSADAASNLSFPAHRKPGLFSCITVGVDMIAPHRLNRVKPKTQDGRPLRHYKRRWKIERLIAWLQNFRRLVVRYEYYAENYLGFVQVGCMVILLRWYL
jgi:hypothetical protein